GVEVIGAELELTLTVSTVHAARQVATRAAAILGIARNSFGKQGLSLSAGPIERIVPKRMCSKAGATKGCACARLRKVAQAELRIVVPCCATSDSVTPGG